MDLVEHRLADHLLGLVAEHLRKGLIDVQDAPGLVLGQGAEARRGGRHLLDVAGLLLGGRLVGGQQNAQHRSLDRPQVEEVQRHPLRRLAQKTHLPLGDRLLLGAQPRVYHGHAVLGDHYIDHRPSLDGRLAPQPHGLGHRHDQAVVRERAHECVWMLAQERLSRELDVVGGLICGAGHRKRVGEE